jgi:hypothetical protein
LNKNPQRFQNPVSLDEILNQKWLSTGCSKK